MGRFTRAPLQLQAGKQPVNEEEQHCYMPMRIRRVVACHGQIDSMVSKSTHLLCAPVIFRGSGQEDIPKSPASLNTGVNATDYPV